MPDGQDKAGGVVGGFKTEADRLRYKFDSLVGKFGVYHSQLEENRRYYDLDFENDVVVGEDQDLWVLVPPSARWAIDEASDHILPHPKIRVPVKPSENDSQEFQEIAENKRRFLNSWWHYVNTNFNTIGDAKKLLVNEGRICIKKTLVMEAIPDLPGKRTAAAMRKYRKEIDELGRGGFLWEVEILDSKTVFEDPSNHRDPAYVYIKYDILKEEADRLFPGSKRDWTKLGDYDEVSYMEYWSKPTAEEPGKFLQWIDEENVHDGDNPYPYIPIIIDDAGFGSNHSTSKIEEKYVGMTQHLFPVFVAEARQMTSWEAVTELTAFPFIMARNMPDKVITVGPRQVINLDGASSDPNAEQLEVLQMPEIPLSVIQMVQKTTEMANNSLKMQTLGGTPLPGVETATEADQQIRNASSKLSAPILSLERIVQKFNTQIFMDIVEVLEAPVTLYGAGDDSPSEVRLNQKDIGGYYTTSVKFVTSDEDAISQTKARFWAEMYRVVPFLSAFTAMERGEIADDPTREMIRRSGEDVFLSEEFAQIRKMTGAESFQELMSVVQGLQQQGQAGSGGAETPPIPGQDSAGGLVDQPNILSEPQPAVNAAANTERDINQVTSAFR
jgi:hypothetical protein